MIRRPKILLIDDDPIFRNLIVSMLRKDFLVSVAKDGMEGYEKALQQTPDIAILDLGLPEWDGLRTLQEFKKDTHLQKVKVMILTESADKGNVVSCIQSGANDYLIKSSLTKEDFLAKIDRLVQMKVTSPKPAQKQTTSELAPESNEASSDELMESWD